MQARQREDASRWFFVVFALYVLCALALVFVGLFAVAVDYSSALRTTVRGWEGWFAAGLIDAAGHTHGGVRTAADLVFSGVNIALGLLIIWLRPYHMTARMVAIGAIGTAAAFNLESHTVFFALSEQGAPAAIVNALHMSLHAISGAAYLHAFLSFPDGRLRTGWSRKLVFGVWAVAVIECVGAFLDRSAGVGPLARGAEALLTSLGRLGLYANDPEVLVALTSGDALFFILFFGLFLPALGVVAQLNRYRFAATADERQQSRVLTWALVVAFGLGVLFVVGALVLGARSPDPMTFFHDVEGVMFRVFAPLFTVVPVALLVGVVRYRLWSVDEVVRHVLVYALLLATLTVTYVVAVAAIGLLLRPVTVGVAGDIALVLATLAVAAVFRPAYRRIRSGIDERFRGMQPDPAQSVGELAERLGDDADLAEVRQEALGTLDVLFEPKHLSIWVAGDTDDEEPS